MATSVTHGIAKYNAGCRCDVCKKATSEYHRARRRRLAEATGDPSVPVGAGLRVINGAAEPPATSADTDPDGRPSVVLGVSEAIESMAGHRRPDLAAAALALASVLDNPKAISTWPAAAAKMSDLMEQLRRSGDGKRSKLASIRSMTSGNAKIS
jgi:hypothetical protein